ncbi:MAG: hypothetical protein IPK19_05830 [Chloroflexi bacterium]|nr:hypothetical protein [Chloroflexota bacterium]
MVLAAWWITDSMPALPPLDGFSAQRASLSRQFMAINRLTLAESRRRMAEGHIPYIARLHGAPAGYGWVATDRAEIGELDLRFSLPPHSRYLWDFATLPQVQGLGVYPRLLQAILQQESADAFFILVAPENLPSAEGVRRAGFRTLGELLFRPQGGVGLLPHVPPERARAGAHVFGVPLIDQARAGCWRCGSQVDGPSQVACDCQMTGVCTCAVPVRHMARAANSASAPNIWSDRVLKGST